MTNYTKAVNFAAKDALTSGNPAKLAKGTEVNTEFDAISTAISSKEDSANKNLVNGYAGLDSSTLVNLAQIPSLPTSRITSGTFADARIASTNVTQHQASIVLATSQITSGTFADARIAASNVTQHQAALTILESQITDSTLLARNAGNETISGTWTFSNTVLKTGQPAFNAQITTGSTTLTAATVNTVIFNTANTNQGGTNYAIGTGIFTAPTTGFYGFSGVVVVDNSSGGTATINTVYFSKNNAASGVAGRFFFNTPLVGGTLANGGNQAWFVGSVYCALTAGDTIRVKVDMGGANNCTANLGSGFSGVLLG